MQELVDYERYRMTLCEELKCLGASLLIAFIASWLLYKHLLGMVSGIVIFVIYRRRYVRKRIIERKRELLVQFKDAMQNVSTALLSGYSIENAWLEAEKDIRELYGENGSMVLEMHYMNSRIRMNQPVEALLCEFAERSGCEDIIGFAEIFRFAKRSGGNFAGIIQSTVRRISEKYEVEREIETILSGKKMEQKIMNIVPPGLLAYLNFTSGDFLAPLYGNLFGVCVMTLALFVYGAAFLLAQKMLEITV